jgi:hypothetical protein
MSLCAGRVAFGWYSLKPFPAHASNKDREAALDDGVPTLLFILLGDSSDSEDDSGF